MKRYTTMMTADQMAAAIKAELERLWAKCKGDLRDDAAWVAVKTLAEKLWIEEAKEEGEKG